MPRRVIGLWVTHRKPHEPEVIPWREFLKLVEQAASAQKRRLHPRYAARLFPPPGADHCQFVGRDGRTCKIPAMRGGATRCHRHGGFRQVPHHPGTIELYRSGKLQTVHEAMSLSSQQVRAAPPPAIPGHKARQIVDEALKPFGLYICGPHARAGRHALKHGTPADWQAWLAETQRIALQENHG